jgi:DNA polymerase-4
VAMLGQASGHHLYALAHNRDARPVQPGRRRRSRGAQRALGRGRRPTSEIAAMLDELVDGVARRLRAGRVVGHTVVLRLRFDDFTRVTRSATLAHPTAETQPLRHALQHLLSDARPTIDARGLTLVGMAVANLSDADAVQLRLPFDGGSGVAIDHALDSVRERFGGGAIGRAALLGRARGWSMPVLPYEEPVPGP